MISPFLGIQNYFQHQKNKHTSSWGHMLIQEYCKINQIPHLNYVKWLEVALCQVFVYLKSFFKTLPSKTKRS